MLILKASSGAQNPPPSQDLPKVAIPVPAAPPAPEPPAPPPASAPRMSLAGTTHAPAPSTPTAERAVGTPAPPTTRHEVSTRLPKGVSTLAVAWLHGRLEAVAIQKGEVTGTWEATETCDEPSRFGEWVREAANRTRYGGSSVTLLLAHPRLTHQLLETPPAKAAALSALVRRQVERLKVFDGEPALAHQLTLPTKNAQGVLVHLFPKALLDVMVSSAEKTGFHLTAVLPPTAVLQSQLANLPLGRDEVALIAAETGSLTTVLVGRGDGGLLLGRSIDATRVQAASGMAVDLNRTLLFAAQQFGSNVGSIWLFGPNAAERAAELQPQVQIPVRVCPEELRPLYWPLAAARLPLQRTPNLVSTEQLKAPQRRVLLMAAIALAALLILTALATTVTCTWLARRERNAAQELQQRIALLSTEHQELQRQNAALAEKQQVARVVLDDRPAPIPVWLLAYLGEAVPPDVRVTNLVVQREGPQWRLRMSGMLQPTPSNLTAQSRGMLSNSVEVLAQRLRTGPFHVQLVTPEAETASAASQAAKGTFGAIASWAARFTSGAASTPAPQQDHFILEGTLQ